MENKKIINNSNSTAAETNKQIMMKILSQMIIEFAALHRQFVPHTIKKNWLVKCQWSVQQRHRRRNLIRHTTAEMSTEHSEV